MKYLLLLFIIFSPCFVWCAFDDGLKNPIETVNYELDELQTGIDKVEIFNVDINDDDEYDRITRDYHSNISAHDYFEYKIEINENNKFITVGTFDTIEGAEGSLQKLRFLFEPTFRLIKISRPLGNNYAEPTIATEIIYELKSNNLESISEKILAQTSDVSELF